jgi:hypothetical protein
MADSIVQKIVAFFTADTSGVKRGSDDAVGLLKDYASKATKALSAAAAGKFLLSGLEAQGQQEAAINKLNLALANRGNFSKAASQGLIEYASSMQETTRFSDDAVIAAEAVLASFGQGGEEIKKTTGVAADFAAATGTDLTSATELLGKAYAGNTAALGRYGIVLSESIPKSERFAAAMEQVGSRFAGSAAADVATYSGQLEQLKNKWGEVQEAVGKALGEIFSYAGSDGAKALKDGLQAVADFISHDLVKGVFYLRGGLLQVFAVVVEGAAKVTAALSKIPGLGGMAEGA